MICEKPVTRGPNKGQPATGTIAGYKRHRRAGERPCDPCKGAENAGAAIRNRRNYTPSPGRPRTSRKSSPVGRVQPRPIPVRCSGCGTRGSANSVLTGGRRTIPACSYCKAA